jgi:hypothetical protein
LTQNTNNFTTINPTIDIDASVFVESLHLSLLQAHEVCCANVEHIFLWVLIAFLVYKSWKHPLNMFIRNEIIKRVDKVPEQIQPLPFYCIASYKTYCDTLLFCPNHFCNLLCRHKNNIRNWYLCCRHYHLRLTIESK